MLSDQLVKCLPDLRISIEHSQPFPECPNKMELTLWATHSIVRSLNCAIVRVSPKVDHETRVWVPGTYLGSDPRKSREGEMDREGRKVNELMSELPLAEGAQSFWGSLEHVSQQRQRSWGTPLPSIAHRQRVSHPLPSTSAFYAVHSQLPENYLQAKGSERQPVSLEAHHREPPGGTDSTDGQPSVSDLIF